MKLPTCSPRLIIDASAPKLNKLRPIINKIAPIIKATTIMIDMVFIRKRQTIKTIMEIGITAKSESLIFSSNTFFISHLFYF